MTGSRDTTSEFAHLRFVGDKTAIVLAADGITPSDIERKRVSYTQLVEAGVNPGVAARIRRAHSLSWSFESSGEDLERRSAQVRGLGEAERAWVAASSGDWETATAPSSSSAPASTSTAASTSASTSPSADDSGDGGDGGDVVTAEAAWRERSKPTPIAALADIDDETVDRFHEGGIISVRRLATVDPGRVADALALDEQTVCRWRDAARTHRN